MPEEATPAASVPPPPAAAPPPAAVEDDDNKLIPRYRLKEVGAQRDEARAAEAAAKAQAAELQAKLDAVQQKLDVTRLRVDLGIDDDDDADRVLAVYKREHAEVKADKRPSVRDWIAAEGSAAKLPKSIVTTYGSAWAAATAQPPGADPSPRSAARPAATPPTSRGTVQTPQTAAQLDDSARRQPRRPLR